MSLSSSACSNKFEPPPEAQEPCGRNRSGHGSSSSQCSGLCHRSGHYAACSTYSVRHVSHSMVGNIAIHHYSTLHTPPSTSSLHIKHLLIFFDASRYHVMVLCMAIVPLTLRYPSSPTLSLGRDECLLLGCVAAAQFMGQILLNRGFQRVRGTPEHLS